MIKGLFLVLFLTLISSLIFALLILTSYFVFLLIYGEISERKARSVCGEVAYEESNYCPNCGADMRERRETE